MKFQKYLIEFIDLDKTLKDIQHPTKSTWIFYINNQEFRVHISRMAWEVSDDVWMNGYEIFLDSNQNGSWSPKHIQSDINAGVLGGKIISIIYNFIEEINPKVFMIRSYNINLQRLYDTIWIKYSKKHPFDSYVKYKKNIDGIAIYTFGKDLNIKEDRYLMELYDGFDY